MYQLKFIIENCGPYASGRRAPDVNRKFTARTSKFQSASQSETWLRRIRHPSSGDFTRPRSQIPKTDIAVLASCQQFQTVWTELDRVHSPATVPERFRQRAASTRVKNLCHVVSEAEHQPGTVLRKVPASDPFN